MFYTTRDRLIALHSLRTLDRAIRRRSRLELPPNRCEMSIKATANRFCLATWRVRTASFASWCCSLTLFCQSTTDCLVLMIISLRRFCPLTFCHQGTRQILRMLQKSKSHPHERVRTVTQQRCVLLEAIRYTPLPQDTRDSGILPRFDR